MTPPRDLDVLEDADPLSPAYCALVRLLRWLRHADECDRVRGLRTGDPEAECNCGLVDAIRTLGDS